MTDRELNEKWTPSLIIAVILFAVFVISVLILAAVVFSTRGAS